MRLGLISDIHGNLFALEAVLAELEAEELDQLICLGDVAVGPQGVESLARVRELGCPVVQGNWDDWFVNGMPAPKDEMEDRLIQIGACWADKLSDADLAFMRTFVPTLELEVEGEKALCFHGSPRSNEDKIVATTSDEELTEMLDGQKADLLLGGHTHLQLLRRHARSLLVNAGSVGMPFTDWWTERVRVAPWAEYVILTIGDGQVRVDLRRTPYDVDALLELSLCSGMPHARWWADSWLSDLH
jgi:putative phosphoesterase